jgi:hypothetical protein
VIVRGCRSSLFEWQRKYREGGLVAPSFASGRPTTLSDTFTFGFALWALSDRPTRPGPLARPGVMQQAFGCLVCYGSPRWVRGLPPDFGHGEDAFALMQQCT